MSQRFTVSALAEASNIAQEVKASNSSIFGNLPDSAYVREAQIIQSASRSNDTAPFPFSSPTLWREVKEGNFPRPIKLSKRVTAWKVGDIRAWVKAREAA